MQLQVESRPLQEVEADWLVIAVPESGDAGRPFAELDQALTGRLGRLREMGDLTGKPAELLALRDVPELAA